MSQLKNCFKALGFTELPTAAEVTAAYEELSAKIRSNTESDRLSKQLLQENRDKCLAELEGTTDA